MPEIKIASNDVFMAALNQDARYYYMIGGRWSAKTYEVLQHNIKDMLEYPEMRTTIARKVYDTLKDSTYSDAIMIMNTMGLQETIDYKTTTHPLYIRFKNGSDFIFKGADRPDKSKGISKSHRLILEELNEFSQDDFETIDFSMRGKGYSLRTYLMHNPVPRIPGRFHWFQEQFDNGMLEPGKPVIYTREGLGRVCALKSTYLNNRFCPQSVRDRLEGLKVTNPLKYKLWTLGDYTDLEGVILDNWDIVEKVPEGVEFIGYGLDFGFSQDPAACVAIWKHNDELWIKGLIYHTGLTNSDLSQKMKSVGITEHDIIIADSAEPKSIEDLFRDGFRGIKGAKKRANYKAEMANILRSYKIHILQGDIDLQREISTWSWDKDKNGKDLPRPADGDDHYMDAIIMRMHEYYGNNMMSVSNYNISELGL